MAKRTAHRKRPSDPHADRIARLRTDLESRGADAMLVTDPVDVGYLTGFLGGDSYLFVSKRGKPTIISDTRYAEDLEPFKRSVRVVIRQGPMWPEVASMCAAAGFADKRRKPSLVVQSDHLTLDQLGAMKKGLRPSKVPARIVEPASGVLTSMRAIKDAHEVRLITKAIRIQEAALKSIRRSIKPGITELELAARLESAMKLRGSTEPAFLPIVGAKTNGSRPHYTPGKTKVGARGPVLIDWGATWMGYRGDMTRTFHVGKWSKQMREIYEVVLEAHETSAALLRAGARCVDVDGAARRVITKAGYGRRFGHGLGHGLGMHVHERPGLGRHAGEATLDSGHVVTIEPGIYLPGVGGVRIEDDYLVTARGSRNLCTLPRSIDWATL